MHPKKKKKKNNSQHIKNVKKSHKISHKPITFAILTSGQYPHSINPSSFQHDKIKL